MIPTTLRQLPLGGVIDRDLVPIDATDFRGDVSAKATLRALLIPRLDKTVTNETVNRMYIDFTINKSTIHEYGSCERVIKAGIGNSVKYTLPDLLRVYDITYNPDNPDSGDWFNEFMQELDKTFPKIANNCTELEAPKIFCKQKGITARFYIDTENKCSYAFVNNLGIKAWHLMQAFIPVLMPWIFDTVPLTPREKALLVALSSGEVNDYINILTDIEKDLDLRNKLLHKQLLRFESSVYESQLASLNESIRIYNNRIKEYQDHISDAIRNKEINCLKILGLEQKIHDAADASSDLEDFFKANKYLVLRGATGGCLDFGVITPMNNFDPDIYEGYMDNPRSVINVPDFYFDTSVEDGRLIMDGIFAKQDLKLWTSASLRLDIVNHTLTNRRPIPPGISADTIPNPHLQYYDCFGNNGRSVTDALINCDTIQALSSCISSVANINIAELVNFKNLMKDLFDPCKSYSRKKVIELPNKERVTVKQAIAWLKGETTNEQTDND